jgi:hypothetical protein
MFCWEIWCDDVFLGYEYSHDADDAILKSVGIGGVASQYGVKVNELSARHA